MPRPHRPTHFGIVDKQQAASESGLTFLEKLRDGVHPAPPFAGAVDVWLIEVEKGRAVFEGHPSAQFYNPMGLVHGGWTSMLLDSAMGCAVHSVLKVGQSYTTIEMKVNLVRPIYEKTGPLRCEAHIVHIGGRIATSEGRVTEASGKLIAHGVETCMIFGTSAA